MDKEHSENLELNGSTEALKYSKLLIARVDQALRETKELLAEGRRLLSDPTQQKTLKKKLAGGQLVSTEVNRFDQLAH